MDEEGDIKKLYEDLKNGCAGHAPIPVDSPNGAELLYAKYDNMSPQEIIKSFKENTLNGWPENRFPSAPDMVQSEQIGMLFLMACDKRKGYAPVKKFAKKQIINRLEHLAINRLREDYPLCFKVPESEKIFKNEIEAYHDSFVKNIEEDLPYYDYRERTPEEFYNYRLPHPYPCTEICKEFKKAEANLIMATGMAIVSTARLKSKGYSGEQMKEILECVSEGLCAILSSIGGNKLAEGVDASITENFLIHEYNTYETNGYNDNLKAPTKSVRDRLKEFKERNN